MTTGLTIKAEEGVTEALEELDERLVAFNKDRSDWNSQYFTVEIRDTEGALKGGAGGRVNLGVAEIRVLWLDEDLRGTGWGKKIVDAVADEGRRLGASKMLLDTYDFQARPFYESLGFIVFGTLDFPTGNSRYYLSRDL
ncbi:GNAT family N-acetyltransferase [Nisaea sp.]|uniref:GNAT family N-acetyltransferase n=1 Tax=Nisaea sp. TaxID=2024842 RepID=UPI00329957AA